MRFRCALFLLTIAVLHAETMMVSTVHAAAMAGDFASAGAVLKQYRAATGVTAEYIEALSWLGRGALAAKDYAAADRNAAEVRALCVGQLKKRRLDADASLPIALGASIEVQAQSAARQGRRAEAVAFLRGELTRWLATSMRARIQKNLNLLTLEGKPAPPLETATSMKGHPAQPLAVRRGHPVLLFFWAHWCGDCKLEIDIVAALQRKYGARGLVVVAPTQHYGYVAGGQEASAATETRYIEEVFAQYYGKLSAVEVPLSEENFARYGVSTTPTLVLIDGRGIVRLYNPGAMTEEQLNAKIAPLIAAK